jgi:DNA-binding transcriptional LysR family regulator
MLTLRQIEVLRAIMVTGTVGGAARLLNVSAPGVSRMMKHAEGQIGFKLFSKKGGRYTPTQEARDIFNQVNGVYDKVEDLHYVVGRLKRGADAELKIGSVPSLSNVMVPRAIADLRAAYPSLLIDIDVLKIEEAIDYLLLGKGEAVAMSYRFDHPMLTFLPLATGQLKCIVPRDHDLASRASVSVRDIVRFPLIGIDPNDPYGRVMASLIARQDLTYDVSIRARFGSTVCALVTAGLGIAVIDVFTLSGGNWTDLHVLDIEENTGFETYVAVRRDGSLSRYADAFITHLRRHMTAAVTPPARRRQN